MTYEPISPELVYRKRWLQVGKHAGIYGMNAMLEEYGIKPTEEQAKQILDKVKVMGDQGKKLESVIFELVKEGIKTRDIGGDKSTAEFTKEITDRL